jgi:hypothetical protein
MPVFPLSALLEASSEEFKYRQADGFDRDADAR